MAAGPFCSLDDVNKNVIKLEYAVRGPLVIRAGEIAKELQQGVKKPFSTVIRANIGDAHAMGQPYITFIRQVTALCIYPELMKSDDFPEDTKEHARAILAGCGGGSLGAYSDSVGVEVIRKHVAQYIEERDGGISCDYNNIILSGGASEAIKSVMSLLNRPEGERQVGVLVPIPQYPLYSASIAEYGMHQINYYLDEPRAWALDLNELQRALAAARADCIPRLLVVINPGNPTGAVLTRQNIEDIVKFAFKERLIIMADEVYQHNVYAADREFHSFKKVLSEMGEPYNTMEMASFMSCSKGYMGECGLRGGYCELLNFDPKVKAMLFKMISAKLCSTVHGQAVMDCVVNPPRPGEPSFPLFEQERQAVLASLKERATLIADTFNAMEGFKCNQVQGAMYAFPQMELPEKAIAAAKAAGQAPDVFYAFQLLENTGICVVPGTGFGQRPGTHHFRTTILPQTPLLKEMLARMQEFHKNFVLQYQ